MSKESKIYSYGVLICELLTRRMPEECLATSGMRLEKWVRDVFPLQTEQLFDFVLLQTAPSSEHVWSLLKIALSCTEENPKLRPNFSQVIHRLKKLMSGEPLNSCGSQSIVPEQCSSYATGSNRFKQPIAVPFEFFR